MRPYRTAPRYQFINYCVLLCLLVTFGISSASAATGKVSKIGPILPSKDAVVKRGFDHFYNSEYDKAIKDFETIQKEHPENPFATNYLLSAVMFRELYRIGALDTESYAGNSFVDRKVRKQIDPTQRKRVQELIDLALLESEVILKADPTDADALYARGTTRGLRATWLAMAEKAWFSGLRSALGARSDHEKVLQTDPKYVDAKMSIGVHNYVIGSLNWAGRATLALGGVTGNKQKGLDYLREVAKADTLASMDAKIALALFLRREQKYPEALQVVKSMTDAYPKNFLAAVEFANLLNAAGRGPEAITAYKAILANYKDGKYPTAQPELAAFGLGISLRGQRDFRGAAAAFEMVASYEAAEKELSLRAELAAGEMYDTVRERELAVKKYQRVVALDSSAAQADLARKHMKQAYRYE
jgi:tetratricopeptide (TPR) repeat protein